MATSDRGRELVRRSRERLEEWKFDARDRAYSDLFEGENAVLTESELQLVDRIDSDLTRRGGSGLWDADEYGIVTPGALESDEPRVVCVYHPEIPYEGYRGEESLDEVTREGLNDVLWDYAERVAGMIQDDLDAFLRDARQQGGSRI